MKKILLIATFLCSHLLSWSASLRLINNSSLQLTAVLLDANGNQLEEMMIQSQDSTTWSADYEYYGYNTNSPRPPMPYTVNWYCPSGKLFGTCYDVSSDSTVLALSCGGDQQCQENSEEE